jgi:RNA polymerase sigma-70 factor (ECF subfamily)
MESLPLTTSPSTVRRPTADASRGRSYRARSVPTRIQPSPATDLEVMDALRRDDPRALQRLVDCYWHGLLSYVKRILADVDAAEDVVQEAFVRLWEERSRWWASSAPRAVLYRIARNLALNELKAHGFRERQLERTRGQTTSLTPIQLLECEELHAAVTQAVNALPPRRREVFVLARFHGMSHREIAQTLEIAPQTVANQMATALATLEGALALFLDPPTNVLRS